MKPTDSKSIHAQVLIRLILSGMYPMRTKRGRWIYLISDKGEYIGTPKRTAFDEYWQEKLYFLGEGQLSNEEITEIRKVDYLQNDEYIERFNKWKAMIHVQ